MSENRTQEPVTTDGGHGDTTDADVAGAAPESDDTVAPDAVSAENPQSDTPDVEVVDAQAADAHEGDTHEGDTHEGDIDGGHTGGDEGAAPGRTSRRGQLEREGEVAADFLETLLDICDLDGDIDVDIDGDRAAVSIVDSEDGRVPRRLIGQGGQVLDALQELTRLAVQSATGERSRLMLDVGGHRAERRATLVTLAKEAIEEVRSTGERKPLTPMTAFERKVVHDEVLAAGLVSESEGSEPRRYVVIIPA